MVSKHVRADGGMQVTCGRCGRLGGECLCVSPEWVDDGPGSWWRATCLAAVVLCSLGAGVLELLVPGGGTVLSLCGAVWAVLWLSS